MSARADSKSAEPDGALEAQASLQATAPEATEARALVLVRDPAELPYDLLDAGSEWSFPGKEELQAIGERIVAASRRAGHPGRIEGILPGPRVSIFELRLETHPAGGEALAALREQLPELHLSQKFATSPITVEVPNASPAAIRLRPLVETPTFLGSPLGLTLALGLNLQSQPFYADLRSLPHLLVGGDPGAGVGTALRSAVASLVFNATRTPLQLLLLDVGDELFRPFKNLPHLRSERITDASLAVTALDWAVGEMEARYRRLADLHVRSIDQYNQAVSAIPARPGSQPLPYCVIVVSELAALLARDPREAETSLARLAQMGRSVGLHLIVGTNHVSPTVVTPTLLANLTARLAFTVGDAAQSRLLLNEEGAEHLLGAGDLLFLSRESSHPIRVQGGLVSEAEMSKIATWFESRFRGQRDPTVLVPRAKPEDKGPDPLYAAAVELVGESGNTSASFLQRRLRIGFARAARLIDRMEAEGHVGPAVGAKPRGVLIPASTIEPGEPHAVRPWRVEKEARGSREREGSRRGPRQPPGAPRAEPATAREGGQTPAPGWDFFISHAHEDKDDLVRPLAVALRQRGLTIWYDEFTLNVGDSLNRSINRGLAACRYGIVVISPSFLAKEWPQRELDGLVAREVQGQKIILPIWHNVDVEDIRARAPTLADRVALPSTLGIPRIVEALLAAASLSRAPRL